MTDIDWRLPANRREAFVRHALFELAYKAQSGNVYSFLPAIAEARGLSDDDRVWLAWLDGSTEHPVTALLLLDASADGALPEGAVALWEERYKDLSWDRDRRYTKRVFGPSTTEFVASPAATAATWEATALSEGWPGVWRLAKSLPSFGRMTAWHMYEDLRLLLPGADLPDADNLLLEDRKGSRSHRNGLAYVAGHDSAPWWDADTADMLGIVPELNALAADLLDEIRERGGGEWTSYLAMESALCSFKGWATKRKRYPNVYVDEFYYKIHDAEKVWGDRFGALWDARRRDLPEWLRLEDSPLDPGICEAKSLHFQRTGQPVNLSRLYEDMPSGFDERVELGLYGRRADA